VACQKLSRKLDFGVGDNWKKGETPVGSEKKTWRGLGEGGNIKAKEIDNGEGEKEVGKKT